MFDLPDADPWDGLGWSQHLGLLWHLTSPEGLEEHRAAIPPPPLPGAGHAEKVAYWTPLVHAARFQLGLRRPGAGLAALSERPQLAAELSPLAPHLLRVVDAWWGPEGVADFVAWALQADHAFDTPGPVDRTDAWEPGPAARQDWLARREHPGWQRTWSGGTDVMHLADHAVAPLFEPSSDNTPHFERTASGGLRLVSSGYPGWYRALLDAAESATDRQSAEVVIDGYGALGTFGFGPRMRPRLVAPPQRLMPRAPVAARTAPDSGASPEEALDTLLDEVRSLPDRFEHGELAWLCSTGKPELAIRDRLAWSLRKRLAQVAPEVAVRREWRPPGHSKPSDLALLRRDRGVPLVVGEHKLCFGFDAFKQNAAWLKGQLASDAAKVAGRTPPDGIGYLLVMAIHPLGIPAGDAAREWPATYLNDHVKRLRSTPPERFRDEADAAIASVCSNGRPIIDAGRRALGSGLGVDIDLSWWVVRVV